MGFPEEELPILIQLEGRQDTLEFWMQQDALEQLQSQMLAAISDTETGSGERPLPERPIPTTKSKSSFFGRKQTKEPEVMAVPKQMQPPVSVDVRLDEVHFRTETEYGLYETLRGRGVLVVVDVR